MKLGKDVLLEIVSVVQDGLINGVDISERLRSVDVEISVGGEEVILSTEYVEQRQQVEAENANPEQIY